ncbi:ABC transporter ATP-binding protein [Anaerocolumna sp. MB42-C2]|uniref:ABC transporter ATP-binding protein n=1 Tax=Anaerocolumna sp. MB42-C2 TaxID=3070997 RepID=UPI0027E0AC2D|nr:ABC transporter ATP-binding protein [Anaerocolumna sp. MB42-C2]WMJ88020.1 ABC transporter ATP-binding protein [Anaerocolumna sp. MB42-C2]
MFKTIKRIIDWCGELKGKLYIGFLFSFFSGWFSAMPVIIAAYTVGKLIEEKRGTEKFDSKWIGLSFFIMLLFIFLRFLFDYLRAKFQEAISYELVARDRLAIGDLLKRVSLGYFQKVNTGDILSSITTGLHTLENMGIRMLDNFIGGYLNFLCIFLWITIINPRVSLITMAAVAGSFLFLMVISKHSVQNASVSAQADRELTSTAIEYARGLPVVKSFGQDGAALVSMRKACKESKRIHLKIEWGFVPANCLHQIVLKIGSIMLLLSSVYLGWMNQLSITNMLLLSFLSFDVFASIEPISDSSHVLGVIEDAMNQLDALRSEEFIDEGGREISLTQYGIEFRDVSFGYDSRLILNHVSFVIPEKKTTAIVGSSGSGKTTICNLIAKFYDVNSGNIELGGVNIKEFTCDSLLSNISMVFQNVYLFHDTIRNNICFGNPNATEQDMMHAAKKACCHDFIIALPNGYDTVIGEGGGTLSGGEKQRISIARAILKDAPIVILDEATASIDPENEHYIQAAISELTKGKTIITIAHRLATIENADQILVVDHGEIVESGTHKELVKKEGVYKKFVDIREKAERWNIA